MEKSNKLELEHLAPYLPFKLKVWDNVANKAKVMNTGQGSSNNWVGIKTILNYSNSDSFIYVPILRPLSDLPNQKSCVKELLNLDKNVDYISKFKGELFKTTLSYTAVSILTMWCFDVFGLIDKGLAKNILELEKN